jgi:hypothetical protein
VQGALALAVWLLASAMADPEPGLLETQEAAAKAAGGSAAQDAARSARARAAHWAPQLRTQATLREDEKSRAGEFRLAPLLEQDVAVGRAVLITLTWDLSQVVFAREETQLALASLQLARARREAAERAAQLWIDRRRARSLWLSSGTRESCFALLRMSAALVALTGGLFREALEREEAACAAETR